MQIAAVVQVRRGIESLQNRPRYQIPVVSQRYRQNGLKLDVDIVALRLVEPVGVFLECQRPNTRDRVRQLLVHFSQGFVTWCRAHRDSAGARALGSLRRRIAHRRHQQRHGN
jgi:hypothetical protein